MRDRNNEVWRMMPVAHRAGECTIPLRTTVGPRALVYGGLVSLMSEGLHIGREMQATRFIDEHIQERRLGGIIRVPVKIGDTALTQDRFIDGVVA